MKFLFKTHKWLGLLASLFIIIFSLSGIFLNHRHTLAGLDIPRSILPEAYKYNNWNNSAVKGTYKLSPDSIIVYGGSGIWLTDSLHTNFTPYTTGMKNGADNRNTVNIIKANGDNVFALTIFDLYQLDRTANRWESKTKVLGTDERLSDLGSQGDSVFVISRSHAYLSTFPYNKFEKIELTEPTNYNNEISAFRAMWTFHSGEMFGLLGRLIVDFVGIVFIVLCVTGIIVLLFPSLIKKRKVREKKIKLSFFLKSNIKWHNKAGAWFLVLGIVVILSGIFLRPPAMIYIIRDKISPIPLSVHSTNNAWFDKLRNIRYDNHSKDWLIHTSEGFYAMKSLTSTPEPIKNTPLVSVMGLNVLNEVSQGLWVVGSFNGLYYWDRTSGRSVDVSNMRPIFLNGQRIASAATIPPQMRGVIGGIDVSGYSSDFPNKEFVFSYSDGAMTIGHPITFAEMPTEVKSSNMSLWHVSLEAHVGRVYTPIVNGIMGESYFILLSGICMIVLYLTGYIIYRAKFKKEKK